MFAGMFSTENCDFCQFVVPLIEALEVDRTPYESVDVFSTPVGQQLYGLPEALDLSFLDDTLDGHALGSASGEGAEQPSTSSATNAITTVQTVQTMEFSYAQVTQMGIPDGSASHQHQPDASVRGQNNHQTEQCEQFPQPNESLPTPAPFGPIAKPTALPCQQAVPPIGPIAKPTALPSQQAVPQEPVPCNGAYEHTGYSPELIEAAMMIAANLRPHAAPIVPAHQEPTFQPSFAQMEHRNRMGNPQYLGAPVGPPVQNLWGPQPSYGNSQMVQPAQQLQNNHPQPPYNLNPWGDPVPNEPQGPPPENEVYNGHLRMQYLGAPLQYHAPQAPQLNAMDDWHRWNNVAPVHQPTQPQQPALPMMFPNGQHNDPQPAVQHNQMCPGNVNGPSLRPNPVGFYLPIFLPPTPPTPPSTPTPPPMALPPPPPPIAPPVPRFFVNFVPQIFMQPGNFQQYPERYVQQPAPNVSAEQYMNGPQ